MQELPNRYRMSDVAKRIGVNKQTLYRWEKAGHIPAVRRLARTKERIYTDEDIAKIEEYKNREIQPDQKTDDARGDGEE